MLADKYRTEIDAILAKYPPGYERSAVMPLLYLAQREYGHITQPALQEIADLIGVEPTQVGSLVGFYTLYHDRAEGKVRLQICTDLPCALRGAETFAEKVCENLGVRLGETTPDGMITVEAVMCLAGCDQAPMFQVQDGDGIHYHEDQTVELALQLIETSASAGGGRRRMTEHILLRHRDLPGLDRPEVYRKHGGFEALRQTVTSMTPQQVIDLVKASGLRGRGGAGFPTGVKWSFLTPNVFPRYVVANADESEPGTFKDREILERNPFQFLEGVAICAYAAQATLAYVYCRGEFWDLAHDLEARSARCAPRGCWARSCSAPTPRSTFTCTWGPGRTSAAKKRRCSSRWKANWGSRACGRPSRQPRVCTESRR